MNIIRKYITGALIAVAMSLPVFGFAQTNLAPGGTVTPLLAAQGNGTNVLYGTDSFTSINGLFSGTLYWGLFTNDSVNPYRLDKLTFYFAFNTASTNTADIERITFNGWTGFNTDVGYASCSVGPGCYIADSMDRSANGFTIGADFTSGVGPSSSIRDIVIFTDATSWGNNGYQIIDGDVAQGITIAPVPEPEIYAMMAAGLALMGWVGRRRKNGIAAA